MSDSEQQTTQAPEPALSQSEQPQAQPEPNLLARYGTQLVLRSLGAGTNSSARPTPKP